MRATRATRGITQVAVWAVLLFLSLGVSRTMVVCTGPHCERRVEFVHESGTCCRAAHAHPVAEGRAPGNSTCGHDHGHDRGDDRGRDPDGGEPDGNPLDTASCGGCTDTALALDEGPLPGRVKFAPGKATCAFRPVFAVAMPDGAPPQRWTTTTGPPRTDRRVELRAATVLVL